MKRTSAPAARPAVIATHSGEYAQKGLHDACRRPASRYAVNTAIGSSWSSSSSSSRPLRSAGPSTSTYAGRSAVTVAATSRAQAGLW
ncbi:hypothetical protein B0E53_03896 [Micromonospora sp. MH33]|nr:hypothetical protein B0E53_03896 [Micromonospora sp. MH33]